MVDFPKLHRDVLSGRSNGRILWQPRIGCWYADKKFAGQALPEPYEGMDFHDIQRSLGCSARLYEFNSCFRRIEHEAVRISERQLNETDREIVIDTPAGRQVAVHRGSPRSSHIYHLKWEVESEEELKVAAWREENAAWEWDQKEYDRLLGELGDLGAPTIFMPRMNVQNLYIDRMGVENGVFALHDWTGTVETFFRALHDCHDRLIDLINQSPIEIVNFGENVHAGSLSPRLFEKYHLPECRHRCDRLHAAGKFVLSHWDGDCRPLLPFARETGLDGIEAITPKPQGDVTLEEVKEALGDRIFLFDGIPAVFFDETYPEDVLIECTERIIELFAPRLVLGISDEISSTGEIERIRLVGSIVDQYNNRLPRQPDPTGLS